MSILKHLVPHNTKPTQDPDEVKKRLAKLRIRVEREFNLMETQIRQRGK
jgi:hypothetical protein